MASTRAVAVLRNKQLYRSAGIVTKRPFGTALPTGRVNGVVATPVFQDSSPELSSKTAVPPLRVAIAGLGTVGGGIAQILIKQKDLIASRCGGRAIEVVGLADIKKPDIDIDISNIEWYDNGIVMAAECDADVLVETIGGTRIAKTFMETGISRGVHVATANKALLAEFGCDMASVAEFHGCNIAFEAAVAGGIPVIKALREGMAANQINSVQGIMNGTCNFIMTTMRETGRAFDDVLAEAQAKGYAETPPDLDVDGIDTAHKLTLLTSLAFASKPNLEAVYKEGIREISAVDVSMAMAAGYKIKLLGMSSKVGDGILQRVHPAMVAMNHDLAGIEGVINAVKFNGDYVGPTMYAGPGAGRDATASAVVADIIDINKGNCMNTFGVPVDTLSKPKFLTMDSRVGEYYIRSSDGDALIDSLSNAGIVVKTTQSLDGVTGVFTEAVAEPVVTGAMASLRDAHMIRIEQ